MKLTIIESPYAGETKKNVDYAREALLDSLQRGEYPFASHLLYTQVLIDNIPEERKQGMTAGFEWLKKADLSAVYCDNGISEGMKAGIDKAKENGVPVVYRYLYS